MSVKERFVRNILAEEGARMLRNQAMAISSAVHRRSGNLIGRRNVVISGTADMDGQLEFSHTAYERFLDMRHASGGRKSGKRRRIHNRFIFGTYAAIAGRLMYDLTEDVAAALKSEFENK